MGARNPAKGKAALDGILQAHPEASGKIELLTIDVASEDSCAAAAEELRSKGVILYGLVNNAGGESSFRYGSKLGMGRF